MAAERDLSKKELKHIFRNPVEVTEAMYWKMIDTLWRDKYTMRTSGFVHAGSPDSVIAFDAVTRIFSITPRDPEVETYKPRFSFYTYNYTAHYEQRYKPEFLELPDVEGLYVIYYDTDEYHRTHKLFSLRNPDEYQLRDIYYDKVIVAFIYWDAVAKQALHFGDSRHGSEWQPQMHLYLHTAFNARRKNGLVLTGTSFGGDGSQNEHAQFSVTGGTMLHDDFEMDIPGSSNSLPILYQYGTLPRYHTKTGYAIYQLSSRACYNSGGAVIPADEGFHVLYHIFATNEIGIANRKIISVMGRWHYETLAEAYAAAPGELDYALSWMPQQGRLHIATIVVQTSDAYTNDIHSRIVGIWGEGHPPVTIAENTKQLLEITDKQELSIPGNFETDEFYAIKNRVWQKIVSGGGGAPYSWYISEEPQIVGNLLEPSNLQIQIAGTGAVVETVPEGAFFWLSAINENGETLAIPNPAFDILETTPAFENMVPGDFVVSWDAVNGATGYNFLMPMNPEWGKAVVTNNSIDLIVDIMGTMPEPATMPQENTAVIYEFNSFEIENKDTVIVVGRGINVEATSDGTKKTVTLTKQQSDWIEEDQESPNYIKNKPQQVLAETLLSGGGQRNTGTSTTGAIIQQIIGGKSANGDVSFFGVIEVHWYLSLETNSVLNIKDSGFLIITLDSILGNGYESQLNWKHVIAPTHAAIGNIDVYFSGNQVLLDIELLTINVRYAFDLKLFFKGNFHE